MENVCRTCLQIIGNTDTIVYLNKTNIETEAVWIRKKLKLFEPKLTLDFVVEPAICSKCIFALNLSHQFKITCLQTEISVYKNFNRRQELNPTCTDLLSVKDLLKIARLKNIVEQKEQELPPPTTKEINQSKNIAKKPKQIDSVPAKETKQKVVVSNESSHQFKQPMKELEKLVHLKKTGVEVKQQTSQERQKTASHLKELEDKASPKKVSSVEAKASPKSSASKASEIKASSKSGASRVSSAKVKRLKETKSTSTVRESPKKQKIVAAVSKIRQQPTRELTDTQKTANIGKESNDTQKITNVSNQIGTSKEPKAKERLEKAPVDKEDFDRLLLLIGLESPKNHTAETNQAQVSKDKGNCSVELPKSSNTLKVKAKETVAGEGRSEIDSKKRKAFNIERRQIGIKRSCRENQKPVVVKYDDVSETELVEEDEVKPIQVVTTAEDDHLGERVTKLVDEASNVTYQCTRCGKIYRYMSEFEVHERAHILTKLFSCLICNKTFSQERHLRAHHMIHKNLGPYNCRLCSKRSSSATALKRHLLTHTGEKAFYCMLCLKAFTQKIQLDVHIRTHTGLKPFVCNICKATFTQKTHLINHVKIHTGEKPYKCDLCWKQFRKPYALSLHKKCHQRKPFQCKSCAFLVKDVETFKRHIHKHLIGRLPLKNKYNKPKQTIINELKEDFKNVNKLKRKLKKSKSDTDF